MMEHLCLPLSYNWATPNNIYDDNCNTSYNDDDYDTNDNDDDDYVKLKQHDETSLSSVLLQLGHFEYHL